MIGNLAGQLFTSHGTIVFVDPSSGEVRHGTFEHSPQNTLLVQQGALARLKFTEAGIDKEIVYLRDYSAIVGSKKFDSPDVLNILPGTLTPKIFRGREFGLEKGGKFLCAEPDGRITLSRPACETWELFHLREDAKESSGTITSHRIDGKIISFFITNRVDYIQSSLIRGDFYERDELELIKRLAPPGRAFVDIGANIGNHSILYRNFAAHLR
ncbi:hypothetical protein EOA27_11755 [Mesorhizobium sp. M2A.F.Ca.ET.037.01.1.1]|uniref:hypothetical protein n=1 Tax=unclassified Mesorhizobium TaxID=325217 RepID=UPI000FCA91A6|nr:MULTISPECIES: hypothetical protein [unclassified Mesorhizobium]RUY12448.1 hypothetical protein EOA25_03300 [Mesorhizobium sp. M2A.F.Ca.ET.040.01.1.1]RUX19293.1 hypothetical protein EOA27_11755 [Mesorhizobium sp. M2A.F.Ca.ET.037.01.1.1]RWA91471.1 MAG: hypothetical protein EOQ31_10075 [Mesorhizobium sp.]RWX67558.1 hypothetical protein EOA24_15675 [Mesorhizobium sp. M2A.F.Ca.ET.039.01.1.1]TIV15951.1 MAG: hypothetical protein E5V95_24295 [Mesorhizobium sp.]